MGTIAAAAAAVALEGTVSYFIYFEFGRSLGAGKTFSFRGGT
jgi:hypothetical protein